MSAPIFWNKKFNLLKIVMAIGISLLAHIFIIWQVGGHIIGEYVESKEAVVNRVLQVTVNKQPLHSAQKKLVVNKPIVSEKASLPIKPIQNKSEVIQEKKQTRSKQKKRESEPTTVPLTFDPTFYVWREVDVPAVLRYDNSEPFPTELRKYPTHKQVFIELWIDESGKVEKVQINQSLPSDDLEKLIVEYYKKLRFNPAMKDGKVKRFRTPMVLELGDPSLPPGEIDESFSDSSIKNN